MAMTTGPVIHVYTICWNERLMLPYFLRHYSRIAERIVVYDNMSDDGSRELIRACPKAELRDYDTGGTFDEPTLVRIRNTAYKESLGIADFVMVLDVDEFVWSRNLPEHLGRLKAAGVTLPRVRGFEMVSWLFPTGSGQITDLLRSGSPSRMYSKRVIFDPALDINFAPGSHSCAPSGNVHEGDAADVLYLFHYHNCGFLKTLARNRQLHARRSPESEKQGMLVHYGHGLVRLFLKFAWNSARGCDITRNTTCLRAVVADGLEYLAVRVRWRLEALWRRMGGA